MAGDAKTEALLREREGYERRGLKSRVAEVDAELEAAGYAPVADEPAKAEPVEEAGGGSARGRSGRRG